MPESIVPEAEAIRAEAHRLFTTPGPVKQSIHGLPKHYPVKEVEALLLRVMSFAQEAALVGRCWDSQQVLERKRWEAMCEDFEIADEGRLVMESDALDHSFQSIFD